MDFLDRRKQLVNAHDAPGIIRNQVPQPGSGVDWAAVGAANLRGPVVGSGRSASVFDPPPNLSVSAVSLQSYRPARVTQVRSLAAVPSEDYVADSPEPRRPHVARQAFMDDVLAHESNSVSDNDDDDDDEDDDSEVEEVRILPDTSRAEPRTSPSRHVTAPVTAPAKSPRKKGLAEESLAMKSNPAGEMIVADEPTPSLGNANTSAATLEGLPANEEPEETNLTGFELALTISKPIGITTTKVFQQIPPDGILRCRMYRKTNILDKAYPTFFLYNEADDRFLLSARKRKKSKSVAYVLSTSQDDLSKDSAHYVAKLKANYSRTNFILSDARFYSKNSKKKGLKDMACTIYSKTVLPREMQVAISTQESEDP
ncbi:Tubby- protein 3, partial [Cladochytrium tenue]